MAAISTHDLATLAGWWSCHDLQSRLRLGLYPSEHLFEKQLLDRALEIVRFLDHFGRARAAVVSEVDRAHALTELLPSGPARTALGQLAEFLAARCGARES